MHAAVAGTAVYAAASAPASKCDHYNDNFVPQELEAEKCGMQEFERRYEIVGQLGQGSTANVLLAKDRQSGEFVAVKELDHSLVSKEEIEREIFIMEEVSSDHVVDLLDVFRSEASTFVVLELVQGGDLCDIITKNGIKDEPDHPKRETVLKYARQLISGLRHVHEKGLLHLDLKPENILVRFTDAGGSPPGVRISDFGSSTFVENAPSPPQRRTTRARGNINFLRTFSSGTSAYWPPETILLREYSKATDMWALGCILYLLVTGKHPFDRGGTGDVNAIEMNILTEEVEFIAREWEGMEDLKEVVACLLNKDERERLTEEFLCRHDLFR
jgi:serine/threonine protein kinase